MKLVNLSIYIFLGYFSKSVCPFFLLIPAKNCWYSKHDFNYLFARYAFSLIPYHSLQEPEEESTSNAETTNEGTSEGDKQEPREHVLNLESSEVSSTLSDSSLERPLVKVYWEGFQYKSMHHTVSINSI